MDFLERGAVLRVSSPAAEHQLVHRVRANGRLGEVNLWKQKGTTTRKGGILRKGRESIASISFASLPT